MAQANRRASRERTQETEAESKASVRKEAQGWPASYGDEEVDSEQAASALYQQIINIARLLGDYANAKPTSGKSANPSPRQLLEKTTNAIVAISLIEGIAAEMNRRALAMTVDAGNRGERGSEFTESVLAVADLNRDQIHSLIRIETVLRRSGLIEGHRASYPVAPDDSTDIIQAPPGSGERIPTSLKYIHERIEEGRLLDENLRAALAEVIQRVRPAWRPERRALAIQNIEAAFDAAAADRGILPTNVDNVREAGEGNWPKWLDKEKPTELSNLTAPEFLKAVHSDVIKENTVRKADIRARDPDLMNAVEGYISQRKRRGAGLGHAEGLIFITTHPARNLVPREVTFRKKFGRAPPKIIQRLRETARSAAQARRGRRRSNPTP